MEQVFREQLKDIEGPAFTDTWSPHHHSVVIEKTDEALKQIGLEPISEKMELSEDGLDIFGTIGIQNGPNSRLELGWRNSMKKTFALGYVGGDFVYVCSNLGFWGKYKQTRIHNATLTVDELTSFIRQAIEATTFEHGRQLQYIEHLKNVSLHETGFKRMTFEVMELGLVPPSKFKRFVSCFNEEMNEQRDHMFASTVGHFHGAMTRFLRSYSIGRTMDRSLKLNDYLVEQYPIFLEVNESVPAHLLNSDLPVE